MNYEAWRISFQSSEQAARAAFKDANEAKELIRALKSDIESAITWIEGDTKAEVRDASLYGNYNAIYESCDKVKAILERNLGD